MDLKQKTKSLIEQTSGLTFYRKLPFGFSVFSDIKHIMKDYTLQTIIDVGANRGQSAKYFRKESPEAKIHCLEPIKATYEQLKENTSKLDVICHHVALGARNEEIEVKVDKANRNSTRNTLIVENTVHDASAITTETIKVTTLKDFCRQNNISKISFLKIDTEGFDLEVLKGGIEMLKHQAVDFVQAEVSMNPYNTFHVSFEEVKAFMESHKYLLFGIYDQKQQRGIEMLRRSNVVFIPERLVNLSAIS